MGDLLDTTAGGDVQARRPTTHLSLSRVGVTGVDKVIRIRSNGTEQLFYAELECFVDLPPSQKGAHMSRFEEVVNEAIDQVVLGEALKAENLAAHIAERVRDRQGGLRAEATIAARYPEHKVTPVSGSPTQEIYTLHGSAVASEAGTRPARGGGGPGGDARPGAPGGGGGPAGGGGHAPARWRGGPGHDRLPVRPGARDGPLGGAAARAGLHRRRDLAGLRERARGHPQPARHRHPLRGLPRGLRRAGGGRAAAEDRG